MNNDDRATADGGDFRPISWTETDYTVDDLHFGIVDGSTLRPPPPTYDGPPQRGETEMGTYKGFFADVLAAVALVLDQCETLVFVTVRNSDELLTEDGIYGFHYSRNRMITPIKIKSGAYVPWLDYISAGMGPVSTITTNASGGNYGTSGSRPSEPDPIKADAAKWIRENAPDRWSGMDDQPNKEAFVQSEMAAERPTVAVDPQAVVSTWNEMVGHGQLEASPGASAEDLATFASATGFELPAELAALLAASDGASESFGWRSLMSVSAIVDEWTEWKAIFDEDTLQVLTDHYEAADQRTIGMYTNPRWIPFVDESTGNFVAIDLLPGPEGKRGQIIYFGAEESHNVRCIADDLGDFLTKELAHQKANGSDYQEGWF